MSKVFFNNEMMEIRGKQVDPRTMGAFSLSKLSSSGLLPYVIIAVIFFSLVPLLKVGIRHSLPLVIGATVITCVFLLISYLESQRPSFRMDCRNESLIWFGLTGKPCLTYFFRDIKDISLDTCWASSGDIGSVTETVAPDAALLWFIEISNKQDERQVIFYTTQEGEARKAASILKKVLHRPLMDLSMVKSNSFGETGKTDYSDNMETPLWQKLLAPCDATMISGEVGEVIVTRDSQKMTIQMVPYVLSKDQIKLLYKLYILGSGLCACILMQLFGMARLRMLSLAPLLILIALLLLIIAAGILVYFYEKNTSNYVSVGKRGVELICKKLTGTTRSFIDINELKNMRIDTFPENRIALIADSEIYYIGSSFTSDSIALLDEVLRQGIYVYTRSGGTGVFENNPFTASA